MTNDKVGLVLSLQSQGIAIDEIFPQTGHGSKKALQNFMKRKGYSFKNGEFVPENTVLNGQVTIEVRDDSYKDEDESVQVVSDSYEDVTIEDENGYREITSEVNSGYSFSNEEISILKTIIMEHKLKEQLSRADDKGELKNRNIRVYDKQYKEFASFCKSVGIIQAEALHQAIEKFMQQYRE